VQDNGGYRLFRLHLFEAESAKAPQLPDAIHALCRARYEAAYLPAPTLPGDDQKPPAQEKGEQKRIPQRRPE
jgi:phospholipase C